MTYQPGINVLSLFDGISCGRVALARAGIPVARYFASEIDKHASAISRANWPDTVHLGDVCGIQPERFAKCPIDLLFAGSPCQGFSNNGTGDGFEHKQSKLFWEFIRLLRALKPTYFLLENVKMKPEWRDIISREVGCEPVAINSSLVSAQSRPRLYWTNLPSAGVPKDLGLTIFDILEIPAAPSQPMITKAKKAYCLTATHGNCLGKDGKPIPSEVVHNTKRHQRTCILGRAEVIGRANKNGFATAERVHGTGGKSPCVTISHPPKIGVPVFSEETPKQSSCPRLAKLPVLEEGSWRMLTPVECERLQTLPDNYTKIGRLPSQQPHNQGTQLIGRSNESAFSTRDRVYGTDGKSPCLNTGQPPTIGERVLANEAPAPVPTPKDGRVRLGNLCVIHKEHKRRITPVEAERLQTLPDDYTQTVSQRQRYRALGNGWTVDVIAHLLSTHPRAVRKRKIVVVNSLSE